MGEWLTPKEAAVRARRHWRTITDACRAGDLHGVQRAVNASWRIEDECLNAWMRGTPCAHQLTNVTSLRCRSA